MSLVKQDSNTHDWWKLFVPDEHCKPGLELGIFATRKGIEVGGELISWAEIEKARHMAGGTTS